MENPRLGILRVRFKQPPYKRKTVEYQHVKKAKRT